MVSFSFPSLCSWRKKLTYFLVPGKLAVVGVFGDFLKGAGEPDPVFSSLKQGFEALGRDRSARLYVEADLK